MSSKSIELPAEVAKTFVRDMRNFFAAWPKFIGWADCTAPALHCS
jgi:hypothetical protein